VLIDARWQRHRVAALHLEPLLKWGHKEGAAAKKRREMNAFPAMYRSKEHDVDSSHRLSALLKHLGMSAGHPQADEAATPLILPFLVVCHQFSRMRSR
jgi:hypothetical protein